MTSFQSVDVHLKHSVDLDHSILSFANSHPYASSTRKYCAQNKLDVRSVVPNVSAQTDATPKPAQPIHTHTYAHTCTLLKILFATYLMKRNSWNIQNLVSDVFPNPENLLQFRTPPEYRASYSHQSFRLPKTRIKQTVIFYFWLNETLYLLISVKCFVRRDFSYGSILAQPTLHAIWCHGCRAYVLRLILALIAKRTIESCYRLYSGLKCLEPIFYRNISNKFWTENAFSAFSPNSVLFFSSFLHFPFSPFVYFYLSKNWIKSISVFLFEKKRVCIQ